jgi:phenylalanine-4-hydroxylase
MASQPPDAPVIIEPVSFKTILDLDHPGAADPVYRRRRTEIAQAAKRFRADPTRYPHIAYSADEDRTWRFICSELSELHQRHANSVYLDAWRRLALPTDRVPQLGEVDARLRQFCGVRLVPIEGLVDARSFIGSFRHRVMMCTQYVRHHSRPTFTPEPDIVHEVIGHAPMFADEDLVRFLTMLGAATARATDDQLDQIATLYWFTIEYGLVEERGEPKAFGAGLLGGIEDLKNATRPGANVRPLDLEEIWHTEASYSFLQTTYFVVPSLEALQRTTLGLLQRLGLL